MNIFEISSECSGLAQRGGLGGVVWGISDAFRQSGHKVTLVMPYYEEIREEVKSYLTLKVPYGGEISTVSVFASEHEGIRILLIHSDRFFRGEYSDVYIDSGRLQRGFFEDDAKRFAFFSVAAAWLLLRLSRKEKIDTIHCHDWHSGLLLMLINVHPDLAELRKYFRLFSVHNLEYQGTRPYAAWGDLKGFLDWFPELEQLPRETMAPYLDPYANIDCINPMRAAIHSADQVTTVSPNYADEICRADNAVEGFFGGRGLEKDFRELRIAGRLTGITNGIDLSFYDPAILPHAYSAASRAAGKLRNREALWQELPHLLAGFRESESLTEESIADTLARLGRTDEQHFMTKPLMVAVTRMTGQKIRQFFDEAEGKSVLRHLMETGANYVFLGKGDMAPQMSHEIAPAGNMFFLCGFDDNLEKRLYAAADAMLMPSDFEPCGTSQMKSMRYGCVPIAARVGGLANTIINEHNGFLYDGASRTEKASAFLQKIRHVIALHNEEPEALLKMQANAMVTDFSWNEAAASYLRLMRQ